MFSTFLRKNTIQYAMKYDIKSELDEAEQFTEWLNGKDLFIIEAFHNDPINGKKMFMSDFKSYLLLFRREKKIEKIIEKFGSVK